MTQKLIQKNTQTKIGTEKECLQSQYGITIGYATVPPPKKLLTTDQIPLKKDWISQIMGLPIGHQIQKEVMVTCSLSEIKNDYKKQNKLMPEMIEHISMTLPGQSGAPFILLNDPWVICGIHVGGTNGGYNKMNSVNHPFLKQIREHQI